MMDYTKQLVEFFQSMGIQDIEDPQQDVFEACIKRSNFFEETLSMISQSCDDNTIEYLFVLVDHFYQCRAIALEWEHENGLRFCNIQIEALQTLIRQRLEQD